MPATIHILDNDASVLKALARLLNGWGYRTASYESVEAFIEKADLGGENCVVSDIRMQGTSGLEIPGLIARRGQNAPVIFITAHDNARYRRSAKLAGASGYFRKPIDQQALLDAIEWALNESG